MLRFSTAKQKLVLTEAGQVFLGEARVILQRAEDAVQMVKAVAGGKRGELRVGYAQCLLCEAFGVAGRLGAPGPPRGDRTIRQHQDKIALID